MVVKFPEKQYFEKLEKELGKKENTKIRALKEIEQGTVAIIDVVPRPKNF